MKIVADAVLLAISVKAAVMIDKISTKTKGSKSLNDLKASPISAESPDFCKKKCDKKCLVSLAPKDFGFNETNMNISCSRTVTIPGNILFN